MSDTAQSVHQQQSTNCCPKELHDEGGGIVPLAALVLVSTITPQRWSTIIVWSTDGNNNFPYENSPMLPQLHVEVVVVGGGGVTGTRATLKLIICRQMSAP